MTIKEFEEISLYVCVGGLMLFMLFIMYQLGKESKAGKFGMSVIFLALGLSMFGFAVKSIIQMVLEI